MNPDRPNRYIYRFRFIDNYDGDTLTVDLDAGVDVWIHNQRLRLHRVDTFEIQGDEHKLALEARDYVNQILSEHECRLETVKDETGKYGRLLAEIWVQEEESWFNLNDQLVEKGLAEYVDY